MSSKIRIPIEVAVQQANRNLSNLDRNLKANTQSTQRLTQATGKANSAFKVFQGVIGANIVTAGFRSMQRAASSLFRTFVTDGVKAAQVQEDAINALNVALKATGQFTEETSKDIQEFASALQGASKFGDEVILQNAALIQSLGGLEKEGLKKATQAAADMSAALGIDLTAAATLVGKAAVGEIGSFSRYGVVIERGANDAETFANALAQLETKFGGAALGQINTFSGAYAQLSNQFGDLTEEIGFLITKNEVMVELFKIGSESIAALASGLENNKDAIKGWIQDGILIAVDAVQVFVNSLNGIIGTARVVWNAMTILFDAIKIGFEVVMGGITGSFRFAVDAMLATIKRLPSSIVPDGWVEGLENASAALNSATEDSANSIANSAESIMGDLEDIGNSFDNAISDETIQAINSRLENVKNAVLNTKLEIAEEGAALDQQAANAEVQAALDAKDKKKEVTEAELTAFIETQQERLEYIRDILGEEEFLREQARARELAARGDFIAAENSLEAARVKARRQDIFAIQEYEKLSQRERIQNLQTAFSTISTLQQSQSRKMFEIGKAAAIGQATIDGIRAVQAAYAAPPGPPFNTPIVAATALAVGANIQRISSQQPRFQHGGIVPGNSVSGDNVMARVNSGEMILNRQQQARLFDMANRGDAGGGQEIVVHTTVELDGEKVGESVSRQVANGLVLGEVQ